MSLWFLSVFLFAPVSEGQHGHDLYLVFPATALALGIYLDRLISSTASEAVELWTGRFVLFACITLLVAGLSAPLVSVFVYNWPVVTSLRLVPISLAYIVEGLWILHAQRNHSYRGVIAGFALLLVVSNLFLQGFLFPTLNRFKPRSFAEKMGTIVTPGSQVGMYKYRSSYKFNFYSRIKRFESLKEPEDLVKFLNGPGDRFVLAKTRHHNEIREAWHGELEVVLQEPKDSEQWLLLHSCHDGCDPVRLSSSGS